MDLDQDDAVFYDSEELADAFGADDEDYGSFALPEHEYLEHEAVCEELVDESVPPQNGLYSFLLFFIFYFQMRFLSESAGILLLQFINAILEKLSVTFTMPRTVLTLRKRVGADVITKSITRYAVCPSCHKLLQLDGSPIVQQQRCAHIEFPGDPVCGTNLFKLSAGGRYIPIKTYVYHLIKDTLTMFFRRPGFKKQINHWRKRKVPSGTLADVYDGKMWNSLKDANGKTFVEEERSLMLTLNVDWFQPFDTGRVHLVGGIYLVINNLPRAIHYKPENAILVGVMPGDH